MTLGKKRLSITVVQYSNAPRASPIITETRKRQHWPQGGSIGLGAARRRQQWPQKAAAMATARRPRWPQRAGHRAQATAAGSSTGRSAQAAAVAATGHITGGSTNILMSAI